MWTDLKTAGTTSLDKAIDSPHSCINLDVTFKKAILKELVKDQNKFWNWLDPCKYKFLSMLVWLTTTWINLVHYKDYVRDACVHDYVGSMYSRF